MQLTSIELTADNLRGNLWAVRPRNQMGTCGFYPVPWTVQYVRAGSAEAAISRAKPVLKINKTA